MREMAMNYVVYGRHQLVCDAVLFLAIGVAFGTLFFLGMV
jgi:hypothetical protein